MAAAKIKDFSSFGCQPTYLPTFNQKLNLLFGAIVQGRLKTIEQSIRWDWGFNNLKES
jgi:hypothetical protein